MKIIGEAGGHLLCINLSKDTFLIILKVNLLIDFDLHLRHKARGLGIENGVAWEVRS
jgi:hypothetical protein